MKRIWNRDTLRFLDQWATKNGTPEDEEDELTRGTGQIVQTPTDRYIQDEKPVPV